MTTTGIDPRIRERRIEVQREAGRRRLRWFIVATGCICAIGLAYLAVTSSLLDIDHIPVAGAHARDASRRAERGTRAHARSVVVRRHRRDRQARRDVAVGRARDGDSATSPARCASS